MPAHTPPPPLTTPSARTPRSRQRWAWGLVAVLLAALAWVLFKPGAKTAQAVAVQRTELRQTVVATGRVNGPARLDIGADLTATVRDVRVREGDRVAAGQTLLTLADEEARASRDQAQASLSEAQARLAQLGSVAAPVAAAALGQAEANARAAEAEHRRAQELVAQGFYSQQRLDEARRAWDSARSALDAARRQAQAQAPDGAEVRLAQARLQQAQAALQAAQARLARLELRSPLEAVVLSRETEPGNLAQPGKVLLRLAATGASRIDAALDEKHLARLRTGLAARAVADAYPQQAFEARLDWIGPVVDASRGTVEVRFAVPAPPAFLKPDMTVSVEMVTAQVADALVLDAAAVRDLASGQPWALVLRDGVATRLPIKLGLEGTGAVQVLEGLAEGDLVVPASEKVVAGDRVKAQTQTTAQPLGLGMGVR